MDEVDQFGSLASGQARERLRVRDAAAGQDPAGFDRADPREHREQIAHPRRPHARGRFSEDRRQLERAGRELLLQLRSRRPDRVCLLQRMQALRTRLARNVRP